MTADRSDSPDMTALADVILRACAAVGNTQSALLPLLHAVQHETGYIDDAAVPLIASALNISRAEVHGVVTFYHDFRRNPAGRHVVKLCRAESCQARGGAAVLEHAKRDNRQLLPRPPRPPRPFRHNLPRPPRALA